MVISEESRVPGLSVHAWKQFAAGWAMPTSDCGGGVWWAVLMSDCGGGVWWAVPVSVCGGEVSLTTVYLLLIFHACISDSE